MWVVLLQVLHQALESCIALHTAAAAIQLLLLLHVTSDATHCSSTDDCGRTRIATARLPLVGACCLLAWLRLGCCCCCCQTI